MVNNDEILTQVFRNKNIANASAQWNEIDNFSSQCCKCHARFLKLMHLYLSTHCTQCYTGCFGQDYERLRFFLFVCTPIVSWRKALKHNYRQNMKGGLPELKLNEPCLHYTVLRCCFVVSKQQLGVHLGVAISLCLGATILNKANYRALVHRRSPVFDQISRLIRGPIVDFNYSQIVFFRLIDGGRLIKFKSLRWRTAILLVLFSGQVKW